MPEIKITKWSPEVCEDTVYLHLRPKVGPWNGALEGMTIVKTAKSKDAQVDPDVFVVRLKVSVPATFFVEAMPSAVVTFEPSDVIAIEVEPDGEVD